MNSNITVDFYDTLGCNPHSDPQQIQTEYRQRAILCHPDKMPDCHQEWQELNKAYQVLGDPKLRAQYDRWRVTKLPITFEQWIQSPNAQSVHWNCDYQRALEGAKTEVPSDPKLVGQAQSVSGNGKTDVYAMFRNYEI